MSQMLSGGYNQAKADRLLGNWSSVKHSLVKYAKIHQQDSAKLQVLARICQNRFQARADAVKNAIKDAMEAGYYQPVEAMVPTGGWKKASNMKPTRGNYYDYVLEASNADIDETFFGKMGASEYVAERASVRYAQRALGRNLGNTPDDFKMVNRILTDGEVTWFPRDPAGRYSPQFQEKFPSVVLESYQGREGQAALEVGYLINKKKGLADIIHYDKNGNILRIVPNQPAESVINDLNGARYSTLQRLSKAKQDYSHKYVDQVLKKGLQGDDRAEWAAKMLERMAGDESAITGKSLTGNAMFQKAAEVKKIMRTVKNPAQRVDELKKVLGSQSLDDFVANAETEMKRIDLRNRQRTAWMLDDDLGKPIQGSRLNTVMKGMTVLSNASIITDAYLKSHEGERVNEISKALVISLAADLAGGTVGKVVGAQVGAGVAAAVGQGAGAVAGGVAGFASGAVAGAIAGYAVNGVWVWSEESAHNMLRGYKGDDAIAKMFLNDKGMIRRFVNMSPDEVKKYIGEKWEEYYQYSGFYIGHGTNDQSDIKQYMFEKAMEHQFLLKKGKLEGQISGDILKQELEELVKKMDSGELTPEELEKIKAKFGKNVSAMIQDKLANDPKYAHYKKILDELKNTGGKPGLWDFLKSNFDFRTEQKIVDEMNARFERVLELKDSIEGSLADFYAQVSGFFRVLQSEEGSDGTDLAAFFNQAGIYLSEAKNELRSLQTNIDLFLADLVKSLGRLKDTSQFNYQKGEASAILAMVMEKLNSASAQFAKLEKIMAIKHKADDMLKDTDDLIGSDGIPSFVKKSKDDKDDEDTPAFVKRSKDRDAEDEEEGDVPAFVKKSDDQVIDDYAQEFNAVTDDYMIQSIAIETMDVIKNNKRYEKVKDIDSAVIIIRRRGKDSIIDGYNALSLLAEKGYVYLVNGVGYVVSEKFTHFNGGEEESQSKERQEDGMCYSMEECFTIGQYKAWQRDYNDCAQRFGIDSFFTRQEGRSRGLSGYDLDDFTGCKYIKNDKKTWDNYKKVLKERGGIPEGTFCNEDGCVVPNDNDARKPRTQGGTQGSEDDGDDGWLGDIFSDIREGFNDPYKADCDPSTGCQTH